MESTVKFETLKFLIQNRNIRAIIPAPNNGNPRFFLKAAA